jgi:hypothetical protein
MTDLHEIDMRIDQPDNQHVFIGTGTQPHVLVDFAGRALSSTHEPAPLFFTWYSSLESELGNATSLSNIPLHVGSHVITLMAKDKSDAGVPDNQLEALYKSVAHIGAAGGPPPPAPPGNPCVIHVLIANMLAPDSATTTLSRSNPLLEAQAPVQWANYVSGPSPGYEGLNPEYHAVNKIRYRWFLQRTHPTPGPEFELDLQAYVATEIIPAASASEASRLRYIGDLSSVAVGEKYSVRLRVEDKENSSVGHQAVRTVTIEA